MVSPLESPALLKFFYVAARLRYSYNGRRPEVVRASEIRTQFYLDLWQDAAAKLGASFKVLGNEIVEISRGDAKARVQQNITQIDDPVTVAVAQSKPLVHRLLRERGITRIAPFVAESTLEDLAAFDLVLGEPGAEGSRREGRQAAPLVDPAAGPGPAGPRRGRERCVDASGAAGGRRELSGPRLPHDARATCCDRSSIPIRQPAPVLRAGSRCP